MTTPQLHTFPTDSLISDTAEWLAQYLDDELTTHPVLLLLSGGSAIQMYQGMFKQLLTRRSDLSSLIISLFDERYVPVADPNSNETQLKEAGIVQATLQAGASWISYLSASNEEPEQLAQAVSEQLTQAMSDHTVIILAGIGDDGHTAGLLPTHDQTIINTVFNSTQLVSYYQLPADTANPHRRRLTATPYLISQAKQVIVYAVGVKKIPAITTFNKCQVEVSVCPAISLYASHQPVIILSDLTPEDIKL
jgi:6-phosphogluconolactonase/glucosamine-6-phosphate isomerase/deaminase